MQTENAELSNELDQWRNQAVKESELKRLAEEQASQLKTDNQQLQQEVQKLALVADHLRGITIRSSQEVGRVLEKLKSELHSFSNRQDMSWIVPQNAFYGNQETRWEVAGTDNQNIIYQSIA